jgi:hypothetical protein
VTTKRYYRYRKHRTMAGSRYTDEHNHYLLIMLWKNVRQMCFKCPFYCVSNTSVSFPICRKYGCLRTHRSHFVRQMSSETNVLLHSFPLSGAIFIAITNKALRRTSYRRRNTAALTYRLISVDSLVQISSI